MSASQNSSVQPLDTCILELNRLHDSCGLSWRKIAAIPKYRSIPAGTLCAIAKGREPKKREHRKALGLPPLSIPVEPCLDCGKAHIVGWCTEKHGQPTKPLTPAPKAPRPKRKRPPYKNINPTDLDQVERQLEKYVPGKFKRIG